MNRGIKVLQTSALPLGYVAIKGESNSPEKIGDPERARTVDLQRDRLAF